jgi:hypothetical protein
LAFVGASISALAPASQGVSSRGGLEKREITGDGGFAPKLRKTFQESLPRFHVRLLTDQGEARVGNNGAADPVFAFAWNQQSRPLYSYLSQQEEVMARRETGRAYAPSTTISISNTEVLRSGMRRW